ncbi:MAG: transcription elongation factor GreA [Clostridia bacterium]|nr:transcription elongation factor GreA [Clostridia bacterium]
MKKVLLTKTALAKLEKEYDDLMVKRSVIADEIKKARSFGDLSENAEYHAAREAQSLNETEILKVKALLENYELVDETNLDKSKVSLNSRVEIKFEDSDFVETVQIVSKIESDPINGFISNESPIGEALLGHHEGDTVDCQTPNGVSKIKIISVFHE